VSGRAEKEEWQKVQDEFYSSADKHTHLAFEPRSLYAQDLAAHMVRALALTGGEEVLEVGAGAGRFSLHFLSACKRLTALDTSRPLLDALDSEKPSGSPLEILCASVFDLPGAAGGRLYDRLCGFFILHHLPDHERLFRLFLNSVRPGGRIGFIEPNRANPSFLIQVMVSREMTWEAEKGMFTFSASDTRRILESLGFTNVRLHRFGFFPPQILDRFTGLYGLQRLVEKIPVVHRFLPFVLITAEKPA
jgi:2-polyprenyl-3-methyl-5-hydroxy-6-metoxy-1,4-benzoquinol methylase